MNILITGSNGQLGNEIKDCSTSYSNLKFYFTDIDTLDIANQKNLDDFLQKNNINIIINCAAYTAVDKAEDEPELAELVNAKSVYNIAKLSEKHDIKIIHVSTDYVFDGEKNTPYTELDHTNPKSVYGNTKLMGERILEQSTAPNIIIRTSWLYSSYGNNFVKTMLRLGKANKEIKVVYDQIGTPTYAKNLAEAIFSVLEYYIDTNLFETGIYHFSNEGVCSWYDFSTEIFKIKNIDCKIKPVRSDQFPTKAKRPFYSVLDNQKICNTFNIVIPHWTVGLQECIKKLSKSSV